MHRPVHSSNHKPMKTREGMKKEQLDLQVEELEERIAPSITLTNPGGNTPQSEQAANGEAIDYVNPAGHAPGGWNK
jgi:hypothetical protein